MNELMPSLLKLLLPRLGSRDDDARLGAVETVVQVCLCVMYDDHQGGEAKHCVCLCF